MGLIASTMKLSCGDQLAKQPAVSWDEKRRGLGTNQGDISSPRRKTQGDIDVTATSDNDEIGSRSREIRRRIVCTRGCSARG